MTIEWLMTQGIAVLSQPLSIMDPSKRIFWPFLLSSILLILFVLLSQGNLNRKSLKRTFFNKKYWLHRSSLTDVFWLMSNAVIKSTLLIPLLASHLAGTIFVVKVLQFSLGDSPDIVMSSTAVMIIFTGCYFLLDDISRFFLHFASHKVPLLWSLHKLHHRAEVLTPLTVYRIHPLEMCLYSVRQLMVISIVAGVFVWLFQGQISGLSILGVDAAGFIFNFCAANLRHSHIRLSFGPLERFFISPAQHQIHHSCDRQHYDKNFGTCLALWDRIFHTWLHASDHDGPLKFGLAKSS